MLCCTGRHCTVEHCTSIEYLVMCIACVCNVKECNWFSSGKLALDVMEKLGQEENGGGKVVN